MGARNTPAFLPSPFTFLLSFTLWNKTEKKNSHITIKARLHISSRFSITHTKKTHFHTSTVVCPFLCAAAICNSQQVLTFWYVFFLLVPFVTYRYTISELSFFPSFSFFPIALFLGVAFSLLLYSRTRYASTWFAYFDYLAFLFLCLIV